MAAAAPRADLERFIARFTPDIAPELVGAVRQAYRLPERFILFVSTIEPRKNLPTLLAAYAALRGRHPDVGLVIAGGKGWLYQSFFDQLNTLGTFLRRGSRCSVAW